MSTKKIRKINLYFTFIIIFPRKSFGDGKGRYSFIDVLLSVNELSRYNLSPNISINNCAIRSCWAIVHCNSTHNING